nr:hypothetical protein [uncultured Peptoniphilus sp.]
MGRPKMNYSTFSEKQRKLITELYPRWRARDYGSGLYGEGGTETEYLL